MPRESSRGIPRFLGETIGFLQRLSLRKVRSLPKIHVRSGNPGSGGIVGLLPPERVTSNRGANEQLLYFATPSLLQDD